MAHLRRNHHKASGGSSRFLIVLLVIGVLLFLLLYKGRPYLDTIFYKSSNQIIFDPDSSEKIENKSQNSTFKRHPTFSHIPSFSGELLIHDYHILSFSHKYKQAEWAAWEVSKAALRLPNKIRKTFFTEDPKLTTVKLGPFDYKGSGYQRGHLVPVADISFDSIAIVQSHYMTNMSPQKRAFNNGIWRELEQSTRDWAWKYEKVFVVAGPIFIEPVQYMKSGVAIPNSFYRVIYTQIGSQSHSIGFIIPNEVSEKNLHKYVTTVDEVEFVTGIDFFYGLMNPITEKAVESTYDINFWPINDQTYNLRRTKWNFE